MADTKSDLLSVLTRYTKYAKAYINSKLPTRLSELTNDADFATKTEISEEYATKTSVQTEIANQLSSYEPSSDITEEQIKNLWTDTDTDSSTT